MQIQLREEWVWRSTGDVRRGTAAHREKGRFAEYRIVLRKDDLAKREEAICWTRRHKGTVPAEAGNSFVMLVVISCGDGIGGWWRAELDFRSRKSFDDQHRPTALGAKPMIARTGSGDL